MDRIERRGIVMANRKPFLVRSFCLGLLILGMHSSFYHIFLPYTNFFKFTVMLMAASVWFTVLCVHPFPGWERQGRRLLRRRNPKYPLALAGGLLTVLAAIVYIVVDYQHLYTDGAVLLEALKYAYDVYFTNASGVFVLKGYGDANGSHLLFLIECVCIAFMARMFLWRRGMFWGILPASFVISLCLMLGKSPEIIDMILMLCGVLGLQLILEEAPRGGEEGFRQLSAGVYGRKFLNPTALLLVAVLLTGMGALSVRTADVCLSKEKDLLRLQHRMEREITDAGVSFVQRMQTLLGIEQPGVMSNISPHYQNKKVMTIRTDKRPESDIYLRGFIGTSYEKGKWSNSSDEILSRYFSEDDCYGFYCLDYGNIQNALEQRKTDLLDQMKEMEKQIGTGNQGFTSVQNMDTEGVGMTISYAEDNKTTFGYFPYDSCLDEDSMGVLRLDHDRGFRRDRSVDSFQVKNLSQNRNRLVMNTAQDWLLRKGHVPYYSKSIQDLVESDKPGKPKFVVQGEARIYSAAYHASESGSLKEPSFLRKGDYLPELNPSERYLWVNNELLGRYYQYVLQECVQLPRTGLEDTKKLARELINSDLVHLGFDDNNYFYMVQGQESAGSIIASLRRYLASTTVYSKSLRARSSRLDYVENFLFREKRGYCEHYATAGAVLFRAMGIPSRYVSGYYVSANSFHQMEDGSYEAEVLDSDAHAWSEVMTINNGWTVADMTPNGENGDPGQTAGLGEGTEASVPTPTPVDTGDDAFLKNREGKEEEETLSPEETESPEPADSEDGNDQGGKQDPAAEGEEDGGADTDAEGEAVSYAPYIAGGGVLLLVVVLILLHHNQRASRRRKLKRCKNRREEILLMNRLMEGFLHTCGYRSVKQMTDKEYIDLLYQICPKRGEEKLAEEYYRLLEQARFAKDAGDAEQVRRCRRLLSRFGRGALARTGRVRRFYVRYIRNWRV